MYCLRWWIPLFLFPFSNAPPIFLILFIISFAVHSKPCVYCAFILTGLFASSSYWYPSPTAIINLPPPSPINPPDVATSTLASILDFAEPSGRDARCDVLKEGPSANICKIPPLGLLSTPSPLAMKLAWLVNRYTDHVIDGCPARQSQGWLDFGQSGGNGFWQPLVRNSTNNPIAPKKNKWTISLPQWAGSSITIPTRFFLGFGKHKGIGIWINLDPRAQPKSNPC